MNAATAAMLDGVKEACICWGRAMRWILSSTAEGYPSVASFERANCGDMDVKSRLLQQRFGEVMTRDALAVSLAIRREPMMPEELHRVLFMHFVVPRLDSQCQEITVAMKAKELGYPSTRPYYVALENSYHFLLGRIEIGVPRGTNISAHDVRAV